MFTCIEMEVFLTLEKELLEAVVVAGGVQQLALRGHHPDIREQTLPEILAPLDACSVGQWGAGVCGLVSGGGWLSLQKVW